MGDLRVDAAVDPALAPVAPGELVRLCARNVPLFERTFFPKAVRQSSPAFHADMDRAMDDPNIRLLLLECFRGSAKTTKLRMFPARRIAYGMSKTILYIGASEGHAIRSIGWLKRRIEPSMGGDGVERPTFFAQTYGLRPGAKWDQTELEIEHHGFLDSEGKPMKIWMLGVGITGNIRGINFDDYRPDLIIVDDVITDENANSQDQREKIDNLLRGAVRRSLAPKSEEPNAKLVMLQTPIHEDDAAARAKKDPEFTCLRFGCWTKETEDLDVNEQVSAWEERFPTSELRKEKLAAVQINKLSVFESEMECKLARKEQTIFLAPWIQYDTEVLPARPGCAVLAIDPVPPPSEDQYGRIIVPKGGFKTDFEVHQVWLKDAQGFHLVDTRRSRGHKPTWTIATALELMRRWRVMRIASEGVAYQKVLKWILEKAMMEARFWVPVEMINVGTKSKILRIENALFRPASEHRIFCRPEHTEFISQFTHLSRITSLEYDDDIDCASIGVSALDVPWIETEGAANDDVERFPTRGRRSCP